MLVFHEEECSNPSGILPLGWRVLSKIDTIEFWHFRWGIVNKVKKELKGFFPFNWILIFSPVITEFSFMKL